MTLTEPKDLNPFNLSLPPLDDRTDGATASNACMLVCRKVRIANTTVTAGEIHQSLQLRNLPSIRSAIVPVRKNKTLSLS